MSPMFNPLLGSMHQFARAPLCAPLPRTFERPYWSMHAFSPPCASSCTFVSAACVAVARAVAPLNCHLKSSECLSSSRSKCIYICWRLAVVRRRATRWRAQWRARSSHTSVTTTCRVCYRRERRTPHAKVQVRGPRPYISRIPRCHRCTVPGWTYWLRLTRPPLVRGNAKEKRTTRLRLPRDVLRETLIPRDRSPR
mgnify:CR=1 FL=1